MIAPMSPETKTKLRRFRLEAKSIIQISIGIAGLVLIFVLIWSRIGVVHAQASRDATAKVNALGCQILAFGDQQLVRAEKSYAAAAASPSTTAQQKATNALNLLTQKSALADAHRRLARANVVCPHEKKVSRGKAGTSTPRLPLHATTTTSTRRTASAP